MGGKGGSGGRAKSRLYKAGAAPLHSFSSRHRSEPHARPLRKRFCNSPPSPPILLLLLLLRDAAGLGGRRRHLPAAPAAGRHCAATAPRVGRGRAAAGSHQTRHPAAAGDSRAPPGTERSGPGEHQPSAAGVRATSGRTAREPQPGMGGARRSDASVPSDPALRQQLQVLRAQLQLPLHSQRSAQLQVSISTPGGPRAAPRLLHNQDLDPHSHHIDLTSPIRHWAAGHGAALRLELTFTSNISTPFDGSGTRNVVLDVEMKDTMGRGARRRRGLEEECGKSEGRCCRRTMKVSFQEIGWDDWVLAPRSYDMRFCQGSCPHNYRAASIHAQIQARVHALSRAAPAPCCVPAEYDPMVLMHYDAEGRLVSSVFEDMLVTRCHCA
uniref:Growth differentiation factor 15 n=1 Tax=Coturnix japonica TaxID=93934 RepID=A0A8C2TN82_COTJA